MNKKERGEFIYRFYRKRTTSFLANLYKASITGDREDIHQARVDVKKILALFRLIEIVLPDLFQKDDHFCLFQRLFDVTGKIREAQVNGILVNKYCQDNTEAHLYKEFLKSEELRLTKQFLSTVQNIEDRKLKQSEVEIRRIVKKISKRKFETITEKFIIKKARKTRKLLSEKKSPEYLHKIRQNLKSIGAIAALSNSIKKDEKLRGILNDLSKVEIHIGEWHDNLVFIQSIQIFLRKMSKTRKAKFPYMKKLRIQLLKENQNVQGRIIPELGMLLVTILDSPDKVLP